MGCAEIAMDCAWCTNILNNIQRTRINKGSFRGSTESLGKKMMLRPVQNLVEFMIDFVSVLFKAGELMLDKSAGFSILQLHVCICLITASLFNVRSTLRVLACGSVASRSVRKACFESGL